ncbi:MAG: acyl carrier protein [Pseudomonadota bacterium]
MKIADFIAEMELLMELDEGTLHGDTILSNLSAWDSLAVIGYIAVVDEAFQRSVATKDIANAETLTDLFMLAHGTP